MKHNSKCDHGRKNIYILIIIFTLSSSNRSPDEGEREPEACGGRQDGPGAGGRHQRALQHHLLCHAGWDPALPPDPRARLQGADAALPTAADRLLPKNHRKARGGSAEIWQRVMRSLVSARWFRPWWSTTVHLPRPASGVLADNSQDHILLNAVHPAGRDIQGDYAPVIMTFLPNPGFWVCWPHFWGNWMSLFKKGRLI